MRSEYDFLAPVSGPLRRAGTLMAAGGAFLAGIICTGLVVALTLKPVNDKDTAALAQFSVQPAPIPAAQRAVTQVPVIPAVTPAKASAAAPLQEAKPAPVPGPQGVARPQETTGQSNVPQPPPTPAPAAAATASTHPPLAAAPAPEQRPEVATTDTEAKPDRPRKRVKRAHASRSHARAERRRGDEREQAREYVDQYGRRHVVLPQQWRNGDDRALAQDRRPGGIFGPPPGAYYPRY